MKRMQHRWAAALIAILTATAPTMAQKAGGILRIQHFDSPASMSILEESTRAALQPMMAVFNNLIMYDQHQKQNSLDDIVPDLATKWSWSDDGKTLTFALRDGVKWHDGKPFTSADVKCTWDLLMGLGNDKLRINPRKSWYENVAEVTTRGDFEVSFHLKQPQPAVLALLASGWAPIYPCHIPAAQQRQHPIGTGPFKFVEFKPNEYIRLAKNTDYWKPGRPYLDGIDLTIMREIGPRDLAFFAGNFDVGSPYGVTPPTLKDFQAQAPNAVCEMSGVNVPRTMLINQTKPPFDNIELRRAMSLGIDREAFSTIINGGIRRVGALMMPPPEGVWGLDEGMLKTLPGYDPDHEKSLAAARAIMQKLGYGPDKHLVTKLSTRDIPSWRQPAVLLNSQLKDIYIDADLDIVDTTQWYPKVMRKEFTIGAVPIESGVDDPDNMFVENFGCNSPRNYTGYCDADVQKLVDAQSLEPNRDKRKSIVAQIEQKLADAAIRPVLFYPVGASCQQPYVHGLTFMVNSIYNGWRMEDVWMDK
jgi:peptide/nickel transport system substrate-binding protein